jgi:rubrerythrin
MDAEMIEKLALHEEAVAKLYNTYASRYPHLNEFWATLAWEEQDHANKIRRLGEEIKKRRAAFDPTKYRPQAVDSSLAYLTQQAEIAKSGDLLLVNALSIALNVEKTIIDGKIFEAFKGYYDDTKAIIRELATSVEDHYQIVHTKWTEHRRYN